MVAVGCSTTTGMEDSVLSGTVEWQLQAHWAVLTPSARRWRGERRRE